MIGQKAQENINLSIRIGIFFIVLFLIMKLLPVRIEVPGIKWFRSPAKNGEKTILDAFSTSRSAALAGFSEQDTLLLLQNDFFQSYPQVISVLGTPDRADSKSPADCLAYLALFTAGQGAPGQRHAALKAFFRYYPDFIDDPLLLARVVSFLGGREVVSSDFNAETDLKLAVWRVAARTVERLRASGGADFSELSILIDIYPELEKLFFPASPATEGADAEKEDVINGATEMEDAA